MQLDVHSDGSFLSERRASRNKEEQIGRFTAPRGPEGRSRCCHLDILALKYESWRLQLDSRGDGATETARPPGGGPALPA